MPTDEVVEDPVDVQPSLQGVRCLGIGIGEAPIATQTPAQGAIEGFHVIGVNLDLRQDAGVERR